MLIHEEESGAIIGACFRVYNDKGSGFLEGVYQDCLEIEFKESGIPHEREPVLKLTYRGHELRHIYSPDYICFGLVVVELKAVKEIADEHRAQLLNYLKASGLRLGLLVNFGHAGKCQVERIVL